MVMEQLMGYFSQYGLIILFIIIFLEYLNTPGLPAGIIMPVAGIWISNSNSNFIISLLISILAGIMASLTLYIIGWYGGDFWIKKYIKKFPKHKIYIKNNMEVIKRKGGGAILIGKLIPMARTIISLLAGILRLNFFEYIIYSILGITIWNTVLISFGYFFADIATKILI